MHRSEAMMRVNRRYVLGMVRPIVQYGLKEARGTSVAHAMNEVGVISYLVGMGFEANEARRIAESWETDESYRPVPRPGNGEEDY